MRLIIGLLAALSLPPAASAQQRAAPPQPERPAAGAQASEVRPAPRRLPAESVTRHGVDIGGQRVEFSATAGALAIDDEEGRPQADIGFIAYVREGAPRETRPVVFAINGGPGASSAWLHLGMLGPWRIDLDRSTRSLSAPPQLLPNAESWLGLADLVFIDPPGTGYSRLASGDRELRERWLSVDGDVDLLASFIRRWLTRENRLTSLKIIAGESYGGYRAPRIARALQQSHGVGVSVLVLVSPVLDFAWRTAERTSPLPWLSTLPTMAAVERAGRGPVTRRDLVEVEAYARGDMVRDLLAPRADDAASARLIERVTGYTGLPRPVVERLRGRVEPWVFQAERERGRVASGYDATVTGLHPNPDQWTGRFTDPILDTLTPALTSAMLDLYGTRLNWKPERGRYETLNRSVGGAWQWGRSLNPPSAMPDLTAALALDPRLDVVVAHGLFDLVTPYFQSALILDQIPPSVVGDRVRLVTYPGGHMFYDRADSRAAMLDEVRRLVERVGR